MSRGRFHATIDTPLPTIFQMKHPDVQVRGAGLVGQALALSLARIGLQVALVSDASSGPVRAADVRAFALNAASVALLRGLKVWDALPPHATTAVHDMHVEGDEPGAALDFSSWEQHVGELAWIVDAAVLERELAAASAWRRQERKVGCEQIIGCGDDITRAGIGDVDAELAG